MRICRIFNVLPSATSPGSGLVPYHLVEHTPEPTLVIAHSRDEVPPLPRHVRLVTTAFRERTTPPALRSRVFGDPAASRLDRATVQALLAAGFLRDHVRFLVVAVREMARFRPELVVCHSLRRLLYGIVAKGLFGCRLVLWLHNTTEVAVIQNLPLLRWLARLPDRIVVVAPEIRRQLLSFLPEERIWLSSTGVDLSTFRPVDCSRRPQLVTIGSFKWKKGYGYLLEAVARVFERLPDHRLLVVGDGEERSAIAATIERLGLGDRVLLTGILSRLEVVRVLSESRLFVLASVHEGLPKALLEALACGTPAVVTDACNAEGIIDTTGLTVPAGDPVALAQAMTALLTDSALWERCSRNGPRIAATYDWPAVAAQEQQMYRALLRSTAGRARRTTSRASTSGDSRG
jgi:glycosyltransferase involved in cell wall biosynthesis